MKGKKCCGGDSVGSEDIMWACDLLGMGAGVCRVNIVFTVYVMEGKRCMYAVV